MTPRARLMKGVKDSDIALHGLLGLDRGRGQGPLVRQAHLPEQAAVGTGVVRIERMDEVVRRRGRQAFIGSLWRGA